MFNAVMREGVICVPVRILAFTSDNEFDYAVYVDAYKDSPLYNQIQTATLWDARTNKWRFILSPENEGS
jgi:hypothetical protein